MHIIVCNRHINVNIFNEYAISPNFERQKKSQCELTLKQSNGVLKNFPFTRLLSRIIILMYSNIDDRKLKEAS